MADDEKGQGGEEEDSDFGNQPTVLSDADLIWPPKTRKTLWIKIGLGVGVAIGLAGAVMYLKKIGPFSRPMVAPVVEIAPPKPIEAASVPTSLPAAAPIPLPAPVESSKAVQETKKSTKAVKKTKKSKKRRKK